MYRFREEAAGLKELTPRMVGLGGGGGGGGWIVTHPEAGDEAVPLGLPSLGQLRPSGSLMAAAGAGVCSLELWAVSGGQSSLRAIICMINNLRYA